MTSPDLAVNDGMYREWYQNGLKLGLEIILTLSGEAHVSLKGL